MYATINTVIINAILDPIFIFWFGLKSAVRPSPRSGADHLADVAVPHPLSNREELLHFRRGIYRLRRKDRPRHPSHRHVALLMNLAACFIVILINKGLKRFGGDLMIIAYGIVRLRFFFVVMIVIGINQDAAHRRIQLRRPAVQTACCGS